MDKTKLTGRPIVVFNDNVSPEELSEIFSDKFDGDIVINGILSDDYVYRNDFTLDLNGGDMYVDGNVYVNGDFTLCGSLFSTGEVVVHGDVNVDGSLYAGEFLESFDVFISEDLICKKIYANHVKIAGDVEINTYEGNYVAQFKILGSITVTEGFAI